MPRLPKIPPRTSDVFGAVEESERLHSIHCTQGCSEYGGNHGLDAALSRGQEGDTRVLPSSAGRGDRGRAGVNGGHMHEHAEECFDC